MYELVGIRTSQHAVTMRLACCMGANLQVGPSRTAVLSSLGYSRVTFPDYRPSNRRDLARLQVANMDLNVHHSQIHIKALLTPTNKKESNDISIPKKQRHACNNTDSYTTRSNLHDDASANLLRYISLALPQSQGPRPCPCIVVNAWATDSQNHTATAQDGATTSPYLSLDRGGFAVAAADVEADAGGIAADVDGSAVEIVAAWVAKAKTKSVRSRGGSRLTGEYPRRR